MEEEERERLTKGEGKHDLKRIYSFASLNLFQWQGLGGHDD
jgi:hypothetical protein